ncbi:MAG: S-layer homology domain-containing protein, partial [Oscillospiraceae bacterium]|nr:S-layer homology domain-containing protein [Oscillospiraceae bacterium]
RGFDLASLLPNLPGLADARYAPAITSDDGKILGALNYSPGGTLNISVLSGATAGNTATVAVTVSSGNYNDFEAEITVTAVDKTDVTISGLTAAGGVYNGSAYAGYSGSATFTQNGVGAVNPGNATLTPRYTGTTASGDAYNSGEAPSLAGSYTVTLALENDGMYYGRWTGSFTVEKAEPSLPSALTAVYGQTLADVELPGGAALVWNDASASVGDAGTRYFKASYTPSDTANYKTLPDVQVKVEVGRKPLTIGVSALDRTYDGTMSVALQIGALSGVLPEDEEYVSCGVEASAADKNAGSAKAVTASLSLTGTRAGNYSIAQTAELTVNIAPKEITADDITLGSPGRTYNGGVAASFTAQFKSGVIATGDKVTLTLTGEYDTADIGSNKTITITGWSLSGGDAGNYVLAGEHPATAIGAITQQTSSGGGSGGGGLSLSPSAGESESESETPSGGPVSVSYTQTGGSVAVDLPDSKVSEIIVKADATATIDVSKASGAAAASLPAAALVKFADAGLAVEIKLPQGSVTLEPDAAKSLAEQAGGSVSVKLAAVSASSLNASQREAVKNAPVFDISVSSGDVAVTSFDGAQIRVSLPHALESGQSPENVVVRYIDDVGGARDMETSYDSRAQMVSFTTDHLSLYAIAYDDTPVPQPWRNPFADVREGDWFYSDVEYAYTSGLMDGVTATEFSPNAPISRAMLVTILYRHAGAKLETGAGDAPFYDVPADQWYSEAVAWASASGIVNGVGGNKFAPDENVTREQFAAILLRYAEFAGDGPQGGWAVRLDFTDVGEISDWATEGAMYCFMRGVITGKPGNLFDPRGGATRAEASAMMRRYIENAK